MKTRLIAAGLVLLAGALGASVFLVNRAARSADHLDSPAVVADPTIDINDVYTWMDGNNLVIAETLYPAAPIGGDAGSAAMFSTSAQYVLHTTSSAAYPSSGANKYDIICTFAGTAPQTASCWGVANGVANEYVTGNASQTNGIASSDGKFKVFAGLRADPFYFNLDGFKNTVATVEAVAALPADAGGIASFTDAGCPNLSAAQSAILVGDLTHSPDGGPAQDFFKTLNALAIVVSLDKSLVQTSSNPIVSVWAATHK
jgi:hypothetical protein